ncbi:hypothetical protein NLI96_g8953 [Meripilus lineatus]|uniref:Uncharacterized protein n=1 Tax=Meripilus lineatus TaxID=2056292 RepID=A0AAD5UY10_9APHY|nr:hypothetical protein NLI96_g8953 [Physisporinus lineatus]
MSMPSGQYKIIGRENSLPIGCASKYGSDPSSKPMRIITLPVDTPYFDEVFEITQIDKAKGLYRVKCGGNRISSMDRKLYAFVTEEPEKQDDWFITKVSDQGQHTCLFVFALDI